MMIYWGVGMVLVCHMMILPNVVAVISKKSLKVCRNASKENWGEGRFLGDTLYILVK